MAYNGNVDDIFAQYQQSYISDCSDEDENIYYSELENPQAHENNYPLISWKKPSTTSSFLGRFNQAWRQPSENDIKEHKKRRQKEIEYVKSQFQENKNSNSPDYNIIQINDPKHKVDGKPLLHTYVCTRDNDGEIVDIVALASDSDRINHLGSGTYSDITFAQLIYINENLESNNGRKARVKAGHYCAIKKIRSSSEEEQYLKSRENNEVDTEARIQKNVRVMKSQKLGSGFYTLVNKPNSSESYSRNRGQYMHTYKQDREYYIVIDSVGNDLRKALKREEKKLSRLDRINTGLNVTQSIEEMHNKGNYHGDVKPENMLRKAKNQYEEDQAGGVDTPNYCAIDFDKTIEGGLDDINIQPGTPEYMPLPIGAITQLNKNKTVYNEFNKTNRHVDIFGLARMLSIPDTYTYYDKRNSTLKQETGLSYESILSKEILQDFPDLANLLNTRLGYFTQEVTIEKINAGLITAKVFYTNIKDIVDDFENNLPKKISSKIDFENQLKNSCDKVAGFNFDSLNSTQIRAIQREIDERSNVKNSLLYNARIENRGILKAIFGGNSAAWNNLQKNLQNKFNEKFIAENMLKLQNAIDSDNNKQELATIANLMLNIAAELEATNNYYDHLDAQQILKDLNYVCNKSPTDNKSGQLRAIISQKHRVYHQRKLLNEKTINKAVKEAKKPSKKQEKIISGNGASNNSLSSTAKSINKMMNNTNAATNTSSNDSVVPQSTHNIHKHHSTKYGNTSTSYNPQYDENCYQNSLFHEFMQLNSF